MMKRVSIRKIKMVQAGWQMTTRSIPVLVKGSTKWVTTIKWFHSKKQITPVSFTEAFNKEFPTSLPPKFNF